MLYRPDRWAREWPPLPWRLRLWLAWWRGVDAVLGWLQSWGLWCVVAAVVAAVLCVEVAL